MPRAFWGKIQNLVSLYNVSSDRSMLDVETREIIIRKAHELFVQKGIDKTSMADIAEAAHKGRRTIYIYFRNKKELYYAIIERELEKVSGELRSGIDPKATALEQLLQLFRKHLDTMYTAVMRNGSLDSDFFCNAQTLGRTRLKFDIHEVEIIKEILQLGVEQNEFSIPDVDTMAWVLLNLFRSLEISYINRVNRQKEQEYLLRLSQTIESLLSHGLSPKK